MHPPSPPPSVAAPKIALIGLPGSGKSTLGKQLARRLQLDFVDSDQVIEQRLGCTISSFFAREGEDAFRTVEQQVIEELTGDFQGVLATGGGAVLRPANRAALAGRMHTIYLRAQPEEVYRRLRHDTVRPLLQTENPLACLHALYQTRDELYRESAHFVIDSGRVASQRLINMLLMQLELAGLIEAQQATIG